MALSLSLFGLNELLCLSSTSLITFRLCSDAINMVPVNEHKLKQREIVR